jgi:uncharacterized protein involved in tolerance to divalent cations
MTLAKTKKQKNQILYGTIYLLHVYHVPRRVIYLNVKLDGPI